MDCETDDEGETTLHHPNSPMSVSDSHGVCENTNGELFDSHRHTRGKPDRKVCWLCEYQGNRTTNEVIRFILDGIPHMAIDSLVAQSTYLLGQVEPTSNPDTAQIKKHITEHMLHPRVKFALQLHEITRMQKEVAKCVITVDVESGERNVSPQAMRVYLTLCSQLTSVYKTGEEKLMYNQGSMDK
jgi:hypothetical protein